MAEVLEVDAEGQEEIVQYSMGELELKNIPSADVIEGILSPFYDENQRATEAAVYDPSISFTAFLHGNPCNGFALDHEVLARNHVPVDPITMPLGGLGSSAGSVFDPHALVQECLANDGALLGNGKRSSNLSSKFFCRMSMRFCQTKNRAGKTCAIDKGFVTKPLPRAALPPPTSTSVCARARPI